MPRALLVAAVLAGLTTPAAAKRIATKRIPITVVSRATSTEPSPRRPHVSVSPKPGGKASLIVVGGGELCDATFTAERMGRLIIVRQHERQGVAAFGTCKVVLAVEQIPSGQIQFNVIGRQVTQRLP